MSQPDSVAPERRSVKKMVVLAGILVALGAGTAFLAWLFGINAAEDFQACQAMMRGDVPPVWKDFVFRRVGQGDSVEKLASRRPPGAREDFGPYTYLRYGPPGSYDAVQVIGKNGVLIDARMGDPAAPHVFFGTLEGREAFDFAYAAYERQRTLEDEAYRLHRVIAAGQDVFLAREVKRSQVPGDPNEAGYEPDLMQQMREIYGAQYLAEFGIGTPELTVEVNEVLYGDLQPGTVLKFRGDHCEDDGQDGAWSVFLHVDDARILFPDSQEGEAYATVPREALAWYRSLTPEEVKQLESLRESGSTRTVR